MRIEQTDIATATLLLITQGVGSVKLATLVIFLYGAFGGSGGSGGSSF